MPSMPLICSSSGAATVSAMTFGLAPGYWARTTTDGGTTSGYSEIGSLKIDSRPATKMMIDRTAAKIGRSMKNREKFMVVPCYFLAVSGGDFQVGRRLVGAIHRHQLRRDRRARMHALQAVDDDFLARLEALAHHAQAVDDGPSVTGRYSAVLSALTT